VLHNMIGHGDEEHALVYPNRLSETSDPWAYNLLPQQRWLLLAIDLEQAMLAQNFLNES
jgi:hypothetical protein